METRHSLTPWPIIRAYLLLPHALPIIVVLLATTAFAFVATDSNPGVAPLVSLLTAMLGGQLAVGATNELVDVELDRISKPYKPIPSGLVSRRGAFTVGVVGIVLLVIGSLRFSFLAGLLCLLGTGIGVAYSLWFKRTIWSWLPYVLAIPLLPIWVWVALANPPAVLILLYPIAIPALIAVHIAQSIPDIEGDRAAGIQNLTVFLGPHHVHLVCWGLMIASILIAVLTSLAVTLNPIWCWLAGGVAFGLVGINAWVWFRNVDLGQKSCFPLIAAAVVITGVGWALSILA